MELHAPDRKPDVPQGHHNAVRGPRDFPQLRRQRLADDERMIADRAESAGHPREQFVAIVQNFGGASMHWLGRLDYTAAKVLSDALVSQADADQREIAFGPFVCRFGDQARRNTEVARILRPAWAGRDDHAVELQAA